MACYFYPPSPFHYVVAAAAAVALRKYLAGKLEKISINFCIYAIHSTKEFSEPNTLIMVDGWVARDR